MINEASKKDILWGYLAQFLNIGSGVIIIPVAIKYLSSEDMGLWYLFIALAGLAQLLESGLQPTISRMTSYVYSGAKELVPEGLPDKGKELSHQLLFDLISAAKKIYRYVAIGAAFILIVIGTSYLRTFDEFGSKQLVAWLIFSTSSVINLYFSYFNGLITGRGDQVELYRITAIAKLIMLLLAVPLLMNQVGLLSMAISTFISMLVARVMLYKAFYLNLREGIKELKIITTISINYAKTLWLSAWKLSVTSLGGFLLLRANVFLASSFFGLKEAASYGLTIQIIGILSGVSSMLFALNLPKLNSLQNAGSKEKIKPLFVKSLITTLALFVAGSIGLVFIAVPLLATMNVNTSLVPIPLLILMLLMYLLELNHSVCAMYLTTLNKVPFVKAALISGVSVVAFSYLSVELTSLSLIGLILSQFIIQLLYNNWYWPMTVYRDLKLNN